MSTTKPPRAPEFDIDHGAMRHLADAQVNVELDTGDMILNIGPQHPATHGTLRVVVRLDGERVLAADPVIGYMHRGYEKLTEFRTYPQVTTLINRIDRLPLDDGHGPRLLLDVRGPRPRQRDLRSAHAFDRHHPARRRRGYGVSGSNLRASGVDWDLRRDGRPYLVYPELDFRVWTHADGDSFSRYWVRLQETRESALMVLQMLDRIPSGPIMAKVPRIIKVPEGEVWVETENPLGQMAYYVISKGATGPFRVKIRSASFSNVSILPWLLRGVYVPDVITVLASLYFILGDIDR